MLELVLPKNYIKVLAGVVGMIFEQFNGSGRHVGAEVDVTETAPDDLTVINGIGPTFAKRLQEAGIDSFQKLAAASPAFVKEAAKLADWQADPADWIEEAKTLA
jgi:predicted flap endonuclease-1-like 5' DNA nuclease